MRLFFIVILILTAIISGYIWGNLNTQETEIIKDTLTVTKQAECPECAVITNDYCADELSGCLEHFSWCEAELAELQAQIAALSAEAKIDKCSGIQNNLNLCVEQRDQLQKEYYEYEHFCTEQLKMK